MPEALKNISQVNQSTISPQRVQRVQHVAQGPVVFGDVIYGPGGECGPRVQVDYQLVIMRRGELELRLDSRCLTVPPGTAILLSPGHREHFLFSPSADTCHAWCAIDRRAVPRALRPSLEGQSHPIAFGPAMSGLLEMGLGLGPASVPPEPGKMGHETPTQPEHGYALGLALSLCSEAARLMRGQDHAPESPHAEAAVQKARAFIQRELAQALSLERIARAAGVSRQHLLKLFRERGLPTPTEYLYARRLEAAANLLSHTGLSIAEISEQTGFANPYHFSRKFSQTHGLSPRAWRQALWSDAPAAAAATTQV